MALIMRRCFAPAEDAMFAAAMRLAAESELLVGHYFTTPADHGRHAGKPYVSVLLSHAAIPSAYSHPLGLAAHLQCILWWLTRTLLHRELAPYVNGLRALGMPEVQDVMAGVAVAPPDAGGGEPAICERQPDWPDWVQVCGFLDMPNMRWKGR
jgi:hypothetical protein